MVLACEDHGDLAGPQEQAVINNKGNTGLSLWFFPFFNSLVAIPFPCLLPEGSGGPETCTGSFLPFTCTFWC